MTHFTIDEIEQKLRDDVRAVGGAVKYNRKHKLYMTHSLHMLDNGSAASLPNVLEVLGLKQIRCFTEKV